MGNIRLWIGCFITVMLMIAAIVGPYFAPYEPDYQEAVKYVVTDDGGQILGAPFPPSSEHWFGTDEWGYDILTLLLFGAKYTIFTTLFTALFRILIGGAAGLFAGMEKKESKVKTFGLLGSIPAFLIIYFAMVGIVFNSSLAPWQLVLIQGALMTVVGIPGVYGTIAEKTSVIKKSMFVTASESLGGNKIHIIKKHIFPYIRGTILVLFVKEVILVLGLMGQLGIFNIFLGGTIKRLTSPIRVSVTHEWAGIVGQWRMFIYDSQWILFFPLSAYILLFLGFYLIVRGLEQRQQGLMNKVPHI